MIAVIPLLVSTLILSIVCYFDTSGDQWVPSGHAPFSLLAGLLVTVVMFIPLYDVIAELIRAWLRWPEWSRIPLVAACWFSFSATLFLFMPREQSGFHSWVDVLDYTFQLWFGSLAYGIPSVACQYIKDPA